MCPPFLEEFRVYLNYVRKLRFEETPDYNFLRELFAIVMKNNGDIDDQVYDWNVLHGMFPHTFVISGCSIGYSRLQQMLLLQALTE